MMFSPRQISPHIMLQTILNNMALNYHPNQIQEQNELFFVNLIGYV